MAARDRYGGYGEPSGSRLQRQIQAACDPRNFEPNLALDLEIADYINEKKGNAPHEAAFAIVELVNNHIPHRAANEKVSMMALQLLDICVKNCGYPFYLQISTNKFLNELVRRFPNDPPLYYKRPQARILELIAEWQQTICQNPKYGDDLISIQRMHTLLREKRYTFPKIKAEDAAVLQPSDNLRSAQELEEEERTTKQAKLQELVRRGTPTDLQEANRLMKELSGYDNKRKTDYRAKAAEEVGKIQQKARILEEMLQSYQPGSKDSIPNDTSEELSNALASAHPKIQRMCEEESDDHDAVNKLLSINDSIHRTLERYRLMKTGDFEGAANIPEGNLGTSGAGVTRGPNNELSLIDMGEPDEPAAASGGAGAASSSDAANSLGNDLLGLSLGGPDPAEAAIQQNKADGSAPTQPAQSLSNFDALGSLAGGSSNAGASSSSGNATRNTDLTALLNSAYGSSRPAAASMPMSMPMQPMQQPIAQQQQQQQWASQPSSQPVAQPQSQSQQHLDPFASLSGPSGSRSGSPFAFQQASPAGSAQPQSQSQLPTSPPPPPPPPKHDAPMQSQPQRNNGPSNNALLDDDWTFSSALPDQAHEVVVTNGALHVVFLVSRPPERPSEILIRSSISNNTATPISDLTFQAAVMKSLSLQMEPQSSRTMPPHQRAGITQVMHLHGVQPGQGTNVKVRWKAGYWVGSERKEEQGEIASLGIR